MHLIRIDTVSLDDGEAAVDLGQQPGDIVFLSFTDSDLLGLADAHAACGADFPSLRLAKLSRLRHPMSVDLYVETVVSRARIVVIRCLGGLDYWRYGVERCASAARAAGIKLVVLPGCDRPDPRLVESSTAPDLVPVLDAYFRAGGPANLRRMLGRLAAEIGVSSIVEPPEPLPRGFPWCPGCGPLDLETALAAGASPFGLAPAAGDRLSADGVTPHVLILVYRSAALGGDGAPANALAMALRARGIGTVTLAVSSLKDPEAVASVQAAIAARRPDLIVAATAFSAREDAGFVLDGADCPVLQAFTVGSPEAAWAASARGMNAADLAMQVALPEFDGRLSGFPISFKQEAAESDGYAERRAVPYTPGIAALADRACAWLRLAGTLHENRRIALVLSDYPARGGRAGFAVGLDTPESARAIVSYLTDAGYAAGALPDAAGLMRTLTAGEPEFRVTLADYTAWLAGLPEASRDALTERWGEPAADPACKDGLFRFRMITARRDATPSPSAGYQIHTSHIPKMTHRRHSGAPPGSGLRPVRGQAPVSPDPKGRAGGVQSRAAEAASSGSGGGSGSRALLRSPGMTGLERGNGARQPEFVNILASAGEGRPRVSEGQERGATHPAPSLPSPDLARGPPSPAEGGGKLAVFLQPDRGRATDRKAGYHDPDAPPTHAYLAFHLGLRTNFDALIHLGTHGTTEWLPGKAVALSPDCWPALAVGALPVIYPFIVDDPGEAAPLKRRLGGVALGHLTPPVESGGLDPETARLRELVEEYASASVLDPRRAALIARAILDDAEAAGLLAGAGVDAETPMADALAALDAHLCDLGETAFRDGLHVFGRAPADAPAAVIDSAASERAGLLAALDGRFVPPGPAGSPSRGRTDVMPTGRNLTTLDPRALPTRAAVQLGEKAAAAIVLRHLQDEGEYPAHIVMDLWASPTLRTGGEDVAHALALMGVRPTWDHASTRVTGFEVLPLALLDRPRIDVTCRVSGAFRDTFPETLALLDRAARAVAQRDEEDDENPLAAARRRGEGQARIYGAAPGRYGAGTAETALDGAWAERDDLGRAYLAASGHAYGDAEGADCGFAERVAQADAYLHAFDVAERDLLDGDAAVDAMGGFAAAAALGGGRPALYSLDASNPDRPKARTAREDAARLVRARLADPRWIAGQLRHGYRGAQELAQGLDAVFVLAATTDAVSDADFDRLYGAWIADGDTFETLSAANPAAARAILERFEEARARGLWTSRRNAMPADELMPQAAE